MTKTKRIVFRYLLNQINMNVFQNKSTKLFFIFYIYATNYDVLLVGTNCNATAYYAKTAINIK